MTKSSTWPSHNFPVPAHQSLNPSRRRTNAFSTTQADTVRPTCGDEGIVPPLERGGMVVYWGQRRVVVSHTASTEGLVADPIVSSTTATKAVVIQQQRRSNHEFENTCGNLAMRHAVPTTPRNSATSIFQRSYLVAPRGGSLDDRGQCSSPSRPRDFGNDPLG